MVLGLTIYTDQDRRETPIHGVFPALSKLRCAQSGAQLRVAPVSLCANASQAPIATGSTLFCPHKCDKLRRVSAISSLRHKWSTSRRRRSRAGSGAISRYCSDANNLAQGQGRDVRIKIIDYATLPLLFVLPRCRFARSYLLHWARTNERTMCLPFNLPRIRSSRRIVCERIMGRVYNPVSFHTTPRFLYIVTALPLGLVRDCGMTCSKSIIESSWGDRIPSSSSMASTRA
jgi:hypothetical protein